MISPVDSVCLSQALVVVAPAEELVILVVVVFAIVFVLGIFFFRRRHFLSNNSWSFCLFVCLFVFVCVQRRTGGFCSQEGFKK